MVSEVRSWSCSERSYNDRNGELESTRATGDEYERLRSQQLEVLQGPVAELWDRLWFGTETSERKTCDAEGRDG